MDALTNTLQSFDQFLGRSMTLRSIVIIVFAIAGAWLLSKLVTKLTVGVVQVISNSAEKTENEERFVRWRRIETYLSVVLAFVRVFIVGIAAYIAIILIVPGGNILPATIGISTFFVVIAGATIGPLLRDFTSGLTMILGKWFSVGDFVRFEPFGDVAGVVERVTLRSTRIRNINGEIIMVHNQNISGVRVTPRGVRTLALDIFVRDVKTAESLLKEVITTIDVGPTMLAEPMRITRKEKVVDSLWKITAIAKVAPSREWIIEDFIREAILSVDKDKKEKDRLIIYGPLVHYADQTAEKRFSRAMRSISTADRK